eukprot:Gb_11867 [translate_table: standard]
MNALELLLLSDNLFDDDVGCLRCLHSLSCCCLRYSIFAPTLQQVVDAHSQATAARPLKLPLIGTIAPPSWIGASHSLFDVPPPSIFVAPSATFVSQIPIEIDASIGGIADAAPSPHCWRSGYLLHLLTLIKEWPTPPLTEVTSIILPLENLAFDLEARCLTIFRLHRQSHKTCILYLRALFRRFYTTAPKMPHYHSSISPYYLQMPVLPPPQPHMLQPLQRELECPCLSALPPRLSPYVLPSTYPTSIQSLEWWRILPRL